MDFEKLLDNNLIVSVKTIDFCQKAINTSKKSLDKLHDEYHLQRLLSNAISFINENKKIKIDYDILFVSICWHDSWKNNFTSNNILKLIFNYLLDGIGSTIIFIPNAIKSKMPLKTIIGSFYAILFHPRFNFLPLISTEAQILRDLDVLDEFSEERLDELENIFDNKNIKSLYFKILKKYFEIFLKKESKFQFEWINNKYQLKRADYLKKVSSLLNKNYLS